MIHFAAIIGPVAARLKAIRHSFNHKLASITPLQRHITPCILLYRYPGLSLSLFLFTYIYSKMERPTKRQRIIESFDESREPEVDVFEARRANDQRLKSRFEEIIEKYGKDFSSVGDEIDLETGDIIVDNGHIQEMQDEHDLGGHTHRSSALPERFPGRGLGYVENVNGNVQSMSHKVSLEQPENSREPPMEPSSAGVSTTRKSDQRVSKIPEHGSSFDLPKTGFQYSNQSSGPLSRNRTPSPHNAESLWTIPGTRRRRTPSTRKSSKRPLKIARKLRGLQASPNSSDSDDPLQDDFSPSSATRSASAKKVKFAIHSDPIKGNEGIDSNPKQQWSSPLRNGDTYSIETRGLDSEITQPLGTTQTDEKDKNVSPEPYISTSPKTALDVSEISQSHKGYENARNTEANEATELSRGSVMSNANSPRDDSVHPERCGREQVINIINSNCDMPVSGTAEEQPQNIIPSESALFPSDFFQSDNHNFIDMMLPELRDGSKGAPLVDYQEDRDSLSVIFGADALQDSFEAAIDSALPEEKMVSEFAESGHLGDSPGLPFPWGTPLGHIHFPTEKDDIMQAIEFDRGGKAPSPPIESQNFHDILNLASDPISAEPAERDNEPGTTYENSHSSVAGQSSSEPTREAQHDVVTNAPQKQRADGKALTLAEIRTMVTLRIAQKRPWREVFRSIPDKNPNQLRDWYYSHCLRFKTKPPQYSSPWSAGDIKTLDAMKESPQTTWEEAQEKFGNRSLEEIEHEWVKLCLGEEVHQSWKAGHHIRQNRRSDGQTTNGLGKSDQYEVSDSFSPISLFKTPVPSRGKTREARRVIATEREKIGINQTNTNIQDQSESDDPLSEAFDVAWKGSGLSAIEVDTPPRKPTPRGRKTPSKATNSPLIRKASTRRS